jgi:hypothetical protein
MWQGSQACLRLTTCLFVVASVSGGATYSVFWGDVHTHTTYSDGEATSAELLAYARDVAHLDFVIVTDHDFGNAPPWRLTREVWQGIQDGVDQYTVDGCFVAIAGYEWTSQAKYWSGYSGAEGSEMLFQGAPRYFNHKNVYFATRVPDIFRAKDAAYSTPDRLAEAVSAIGGLIHNNHPSSGIDGRDQWEYSRQSARVIANREIGPDVLWYGGTKHETQTEQTVCDFLNHGGRTGFVAGSDTHEGRPAARAAIWAGGLSRGQLLGALRARRNYALTGARILLDFRINGHWMGEQIEIRGRPHLRVRVQGTVPIAEMLVVRDGAELLRVTPHANSMELEHSDESFPGDSYYYVRVTQADLDEHGNPSRAWSSPIWVKGH